MIIHYEVDTNHKLEVTLDVGAFICSTGKLMVVGTGVSKHEAITNALKALDMVKTRLPELEKQIRDF